MALLRAALITALAASIVLGLFAGSGGTAELEEQYKVKGFERFLWQPLPDNQEFTVENGTCRLENQTNQNLLLLSASELADLSLSVEVEFAGREPGWAGLLFGYKYFSDLDAASYTQAVVHTDGRLSIGRIVRDAPREAQRGRFPLNRKHPRQVSLRITKLRDRLHVIANGGTMEYRLPSNERAGNFGLVLAPHSRVVMSKLELTIYTEPHIPFKGIRYQDIFGEPGKQG